MATAPKFVLVMRHAEKPDNAFDPHLSPDGLERARWLSDYIPTTFGTPDFIIAAADSRESMRPRETVEPLKKRTGKPVDHRIASKQFEDLAHKLLTDDKYSARRIVVCWHHGHIPPLLHALGAKQGDYPDPWDPQVYDLILKIDFADEGKLKVAAIQEPFRKKN